MEIDVTTQTAGLQAEITLEPDLEIVDAHHHLGDAQGVPYFLDEFLADTRRGHKVVQSVFIEASWGWSSDSPDPARGLPEIRRVAEIARESERRGGARISGIVGFVDLRHGRRAGEIIDRASEEGGGYLVGLRHVAGWDPDPQTPVMRGRPPASLMADPAWRDGFKEVVDRGLPFDALVFHPQLGDVADLASAFPDAVIVLNHMGFPLTTGRYQGRPEQTLLEWRAAHEQLARHPGVNVKIGGIGISIIRQLREPDLTRTATSELLAEQWKAEILWLVDLYGADRCLLESNFPVDAATCSYHTLWNTYKRVFSESSQPDKEKIFAGTARRLYGIGTAPSPAVPSM